MEEAKFETESKRLFQEAKPTLFLEAVFPPYFFCYRGRYLQILPYLRHGGDPLYILLPSLNPYGIYFTLQYIFAPLPLGGRN
ncbi:hypothetical protein SAMN04488519_103144 [Algoriphagus ornithinivorans]|uniref:Uncharacterized protein n=1 Tax=Algoriphagus ornithinivorans TaxID=226506 RepID=A0A1I5DTH0_9BACT|nr:hypothetical protein SAMN04488519_103144 [Algoriphagus ornithinivorans]